MFNYCSSQSNYKDHYEMKRETMVESQIKARGITDQDVLNAMLKVERHLFVPAELAKEAYMDYPLPIGEGQTISQPYIVALMTEVLNLNENSRVLEIGTGSGYQAAVLAEICDSVFSVEIFESLASKAANLLKVLGYSNIKIKSGDGYMGWPEFSPFDAIIVTCAPTEIPQPLLDQLAEGGKMVIPVGESHSQELLLLEKRKGTIKEKAIVPVRFVPMIDTSRNKY
ncbi:MAG: protein-L-isoaspartate(D-aspartate) O-methyltransferase [Bacteroidetes bacterium]|nr:protein-L-isoaspartate(D-aspartate) O-methyltransferase [Bacteroidota bacterium]